MKNSKQINVLIAEDDFLVTEEIAHALKKVGYNKIGVATDGKMAVEMTCELNPDVVLMDIKMPKLDGLEASKQIQRKHPTPIVILSAYESPELTERASKVGVLAYITKPPKKNELERSIQIAIARHNDLMDSYNITTNLKTKIQKRKKLEQNLRTAAKEKEIQLKEAHHRIKNNFQLVSSLINLELLDIKDPETEKILQNCQERILLVASLHESLYQTSKIGKVDMSYYLGNVVNCLCDSHKIKRNETLVHTDFEEIYIPSKLATSCGIIFNELFTNAVKHGSLSEADILKGKKREIGASFVRKPGKKIEMSVYNNGITFPEDIDFRNTDSLGLQLVIMLVEQIQGTIDLQREKGTKFTVLFKP